MLQKCILHSVTSQACSTIPMIFKNQFTQPTLQTQTHNTMSQTLSTMQKNTRNMIILWGKEQSLCHQLAQLLGKLKVMRHYCHMLGVNHTQVAVLEMTCNVGFRCLLQCLHRIHFELQVWLNAHLCLGAKPFELTQKHWLLRPRHLWHQMWCHKEFCCSTWRTSKQTSTEKIFFHCIPQGSEGKNNFTTFI